MKPRILKKTLIGMAVLLPLLYMLFFQIGLLLAVVLVGGALLLAYAIGDILLAEYWMWK